MLQSFENRSGEKCKYRLELNLFRADINLYLVNALEYTYVIPTPSLQCTSGGMCIDISAKIHCMVRGERVDRIRKKKYGQALEGPKILDINADTHPEPELVREDF